MVTWSYLIDYFFAGKVAEVPDPRVPGQRHVRHDQEGNQDNQRVKILSI